MAALNCIGAHGRCDMSVWLHTPEDLVAVFEATANPNHATSLSRVRTWCLTPLEISTPRLTQLRDRYVELAPTERHGGIDDDIRVWYAEHR